MFYIEKEDKLLDKNFCDEFRKKIINKFNSSKYKDIIDPNFLTHISKPNAISLFKTLKYDVDAKYKCDVIFDVKLEETNIVSDGYEAKTTGEGRREYTTGRLIIDAKTTYEEKSHYETKTKYVECLKTYTKHYSFDGKDEFRKASLTEIQDIDSNYRKGILDEIYNHEWLYNSVDKYSVEVKNVKEEYDNKVPSNVQVIVKAKEVKVTSPSINMVDVYASYNYCAAINYNGKKYIYSEYDNFNEDFPLNKNAQKTVKSSKKIYAFQRTLAWIMGIPTFIALGAILIVAIFMRFKGEQDFLVYINFPFTIIDIVVAIVYFLLFQNFIGKLNDVINSSSGSHMLNRTRNRTRTAIMEILYYVTATGSLILAIFQLICVVNAFQVALTYA